MTLGQRAKKLVAEIREIKSVIEEEVDFSAIEDEQEREDFISWKSDRMARKFEKENPSEDPKMNKEAVDEFTYAEIMKGYVF